MFIKIIDYLNIYFRCLKFSIVLSREIQDKEYILKHKNENFCFKQFFDEMWKSYMVNKNG